MNRSEWIALSACIASFLGLIPSFYSILSQNKKAKKKNIKPEPSEPTLQIEHKLNIIELKKDSMPPMMRILVLILMAVIIGLIELILFSTIASFCDIKVGFHAMPLVWEVCFYSLFIIPGILFLFAIMVLITLFDD